MCICAPDVFEHSTCCIAGDALMVHALMYRSVQVGDMLVHADGVRWLTYVR